MGGTHVRETGGGNVANMTRFHLVCCWLEMVAKCWESIVDQRKFRSSNFRLY